MSIHQGQGSSEEDPLPITFPLHGYTDYEALEASTSDPSRNSGRHTLHGADDLISLFGLRPLWERSVKPYTSASQRKAWKEAKFGEENGGKVDNTRVNEGGADESETSTKPIVMEKTYVNYVHDIPGKVRPSKKTITKYNSSLANASANGISLPSLPTEITGRTTMRDIVFRPETTVQRIGPFDQDALAAAFTVEAGDVPDVCLYLHFHRAY